ncbi:hypothetical protein [Nocardia huaxiensis]|uniref:Resolvase/invertase-type recombinase catalytic domain-containing protein n=1 Tax=Nocardia huaxiensis TaxID=2755382 RepID=A0A7D6VJ59_9NOCA|nr:hypothetical protein [Nocardia huaxiensis]QLY31256.1 hypothetical protein H0264_02465 [Nocardia huaxiensis]UFS94796.1 hypothetical protein LPY97_29290 [Nocardia huaxiensis]
MFGHATAIGYLRSDISGARKQWDEHQNRGRAARLGYTLAKTVVFSQRTDDPIQRLINVIRNTGAEAIVVPSADHFGGDIPEALVRVADVITVQPERTYARWSAGQLPEEMRAE